MRMTDLLTIGEVSRRSGLAVSALRYYESQGLIDSTRTSGNQRRYQRSVLRKIAFVRAARSIGLPLDEIAETMRTLPGGRAPTRADWAQLSQSWRGRLDEQIRALETLRDGLESCIGCGCLSLRTCALSNPGDVAAGYGPGAAFLPDALHMTTDTGTDGHRDDRHHTN